MKRAITLIALIGTFSTGFSSYNNEAYLIKDAPAMYSLHATAYCLPGKTYTGKKVRRGIYATGRKEWLGMTALIYQRLPNGDPGDLIGIYEIEDTGCSEDVLDVWCEDLDSCQDFMDEVYKDGCQGKVFAQIVDAKG